MLCVDVDDGTRKLVYDQDKLISVMHIDLVISKLKLYKTLLLYKYVLSRYYNLSTSIFGIVKDHVFSVYDFFIYIFLGWFTD